MRSPIISAFFLLLCFIFSVCPMQSVNINNTMQNFLPGNESKTSKYIKDLLRKINKPAVKTIQSPDGDIIDCVPTHLQLAFDHPLLKGQKPIMDTPEMPKGYTSHTDIFEEDFQVWSMSGESCPENTIPVIRTTEQDILSAKPVRRFGRKTVRNGGGDNIHEHAVGFVMGKYYGVEATINVWLPSIENVNEVSISQIWVMACTFGVDQNSIEVGWKVLYGDTYPAFFIYWTGDAYIKTGCYNLDCPGFVQTNNGIALGARIRNFSSYKGDQFDLTFFVWRDSGNGNWLLKLNGIQVGYWPSIILPILTKEATVVEFGGEITNTGSSGSHTSTQMGSGHFPSEGYGKASYVRNIQVINSGKYKLAPNISGAVYEKPNCYYVGIGSPSKTWGTYLFYGGPGRNLNCP